MENKPLLLPVNFLFLHPLLSVLEKFPFPCFHVVWDTFSVVLFLNNFSWKPKPSFDWGKSSSPDVHQTHLSVANSPLGFKLWELWDFIVNACSGLLLFWASCYIRHGEYLKVFSKLMLPCSPPVKSFELSAWSEFTSLCFVSFLTPPLAPYITMRKWLINQNNTDREVRRLVPNIDLVTPQVIGFLN